MAGVTREQVRKFLGMKKTFTRPKDHEPKMTAREKAMRKALAKRKLKEEKRKREIEEQNRRMRGK